ncbi:hypothetical protein LINPERPRIM_LOCUS2441 [Linum perenne]
MIRFRVNLLKYPIGDDDFDNNGNEVKVPTYLARLGGVDESMTLVLTMSAWQGFDKWHCRAKNLKHRTWDLINSQ